MNKLIRKQAPREPRHAVKSADSLLRVVVERERQPRCLDAELLDLSTGGAKVRIECPVQFNEKLTLRLTSHEPPLMLTIATCVRHLQQGSDGKWTFGCSFEPRLPQDRLDQLFSQGFVERRTAKRMRVAVPASIRWELQPEEVLVEIFDLSRGGFCIASLDPGRVGARLRLRPEGPDCGSLDILATARWQADLQKGYLIGCTFLQPGYSQLRELATEQQKRIAASQTPSWLQSLMRLSPRSRSG